MSRSSPQGRSIRLKGLFRIVSGATPSPEPVNWNGDVAWATPIDIGRRDGGVIESTDRTISRNGLEGCATEVAPAGSLVLSTRAPIGYVSETRIPMAINQGCRLLVPRRNVESSFYRYVLSVRRPELQALGRGSTFLELSTTDLGNLLMPAPSGEKQRAIVRYLGEQTSKIDALIQRKRCLLEALKTQSISVITQVVMRGTDPTVEGADSGVEWLGEVPAHWRVLRCGVLFRERDERGAPDLPPLHVSLNTGVTLRAFTEDRIERVAADLGTQKIARRGDLVFNKMRMWQGAVGVAPTDGLVSTDYTVAAPSSGIDTLYVQLVLRTSSARTEIDKWSHGMVRDRNRLYWDGFKSIRIPVPPLKEQQEIAEHAASQVKTITTVQQRVLEAIDKLKEYRSALITAAVTGQVDVGEAA